MKNKISTKLIAVGSMTIAILGIFLYFFIKSQQQIFILRIKQNANQLSEMIKSSTKYDMLLNRREHVHKIIDTIGQQEGIEKVRIFNKEGEIIYSSDKSVVGTMVDKQAEACYVCHTANQPLERLAIFERTRIFRLKGSTRSLGIINPVYNESSCWQAACHAHPKEQKVLGVLDVSMSLAEVDNLIIFNQKKIIFLTLAAIVFISFIFWLFFQKFITRPVNRLVDATNTVAKGDLSYQTEIKRNDELGLLGKSFNEMTRKLAEAQRQLYHSDKLASIGRLAAGVAHEINNPLTGVLTYSSVLLKRSDHNPEMKSDLEIIVQETKRCREIVKGLLDFARQFPSKKTSVDFNEVIKHSLFIVENQLNCSHVKAHKQLSKLLPTIHADASQLQQVLVNLLVNATDAIGTKGGEITITTQSKQEDGKTFVEAKITDTGCGISPQNLSKIFEPFYSTKEQKGTGLGLAVVWGIINEHKGTIKAESKLGEGSTFTIRFSAGNEASLIV